jgi:NADH dehydrogenase
VAVTPITQARRHSQRIVIAGAGFGGYSAARQLAKSLGSRDDVRVTLVNPTSFMLHQPLLPGVTGATLSPQHIVVPLREALPHTDLLVGRVEDIDKDHGRVAVSTAAGSRVLPYDHVLIALGSTSKVQPVPGLTEHGIGLKTLADAISIRNRVVNHLERAELTSDPDELDSLLSFVVVGGGYAGVETIAALEDFARDVSRRYPRAREHGMRWTLVESKPQVMRELPPEMSAFASGELRRRGVDVCCGTKVVQIDGGSVTLSSGQAFPCATVVWTAGVVPPPLVRRLGLPMNGKRIQTQADLRVEGEENVWAVGDSAAIPRESEPNGLCPPTAQFAVRQGKAVGRNIAAALGHGRAQPFTYNERGGVGDMGRGKAVARTGKLRWRGFPAFVIGRALHAAWIPGGRRTVRVVNDWTLDVILGRVGLDLGDIGPREKLAVPTEEGAERAA